MNYTIFRLMYKIKNDYDNRNNEDVEDVLNLVEKNVDCTNKLIQRIDILIENKHFSESILQILITIRNTCAVNVMNINRLTK